MNKVRYKLFCISICFILISCDPGVFYQKIVQNNSPHEIKIFRYNNTISNSNKYILQDSFLLHAKTESILSRGGGLSEAPPCNSIVDSFVVKVHSNQNLNVLTDLNKNNSWIRNSSGSSAKGFNVTCRATIADSDIVPK